MDTYWFPKFMIKIKNLDGRGVDLGEGEAAGSWEEEEETAWDELYGRWICFQ